MTKVGKSRAGKSVAIVAMGGSHRSYTGLASALGDRHRIASEVWAINSMGTVIDHDLLFHMDDCRIQEARAEQDPTGNVAGMLAWLRKHPGFFTSRVYQDYPGAQAYPLQAVIDRFGHAYFNSTVAYAFAYALYQGFDSISLFGCDFSYPNSHHAERGRGCLEFWIGVACALGVNVQVAGDSTLLDSNCPLSLRLYGYDAYDIKLQSQQGKSTPQVALSVKAEMPTAEEIEARYRNEVAA